jgi:predicted nucleic acid-binding protein
VALIVATGPLFAALYSGDRDHVRCAALFDTDETVIVPAPVVVETEWLATSRLGPNAFDPIYDDILSGALVIHELTLLEWERIRQLCTRYADLPLGLVDASVVALAETLGEQVVATLDRRHFAAVRPRHVDSFHLIPN